MGNQRSIWGWQTVRNRTSVSHWGSRKPGHLSTPVSLWRPSLPGFLDPTCSCLPETINPLGLRLCYSVYWGPWDPFRKAIRSKLFLQQASLMVKNLPDNAGDPGSIPFLSPGDPSRKDPLEKEMAPHSSILTREISWTEKPGRQQSLRSQRVRHGWATNTFTFIFLQQH